MCDLLTFYVGGAWVPPDRLETLDVINPADDSVAGRISLGGAADVDRAVQAAREAFDSWSRTSRAERLQEFLEAKTVLGYA